MPLPDDQGRRAAEHVLAGRPHDQARIPARVDDAAHFIFEFHADQQPGAADVRDVPVGLGERLQAPGQFPAHFQGPVGQALVDHPGHDGVGHVAGHRVRPEGGPVHARLEDFRDVGLHHHGADGQAAGQRLGQGHHVRLDPVMLVGEELARAAQAALDFVEDQGDIAFVAQPAQVRQEFHVGGIHAALALDGFDHDRRGLLRRDRRLERLDLVEREVDHAGDHGLEPFVVLGLGRGADRAVGAAVKGVLEGHDLVLGLAARLGRPPAGEFQGRFDGLRTAVAEEHSGREGVVHEQLRESHVGLGVVQVGDVHQFRGLLRHGADDFGHPVAQGIYRDAPQEIEIPPALEVVDVGSAAPVEHDGGTHVGRRDVLFLQGDDLFGSHAGSFLPVNPAVAS